MAIFSMVASAGKRRVRLQCSATAPHRPHQSADGSTSVGRHLHQWQAIILTHVRECSKSRPRRVAVMEALYIIAPVSRHQDQAQNPHAGCSIQHTLHQSYGHLNIAGTRFLHNRTLGLNGVVPTFRGALFRKCPEKGRWAVCGGGHSISAHARLAPCEQALHHA